MGGEMMVGIRDRNGKEGLSLRHTNPMPWILRHPSFYSNEAYLQEIIDRAQPENSWPKSVPCERVEPSEYGVILVDFVTHQIISRQDYCSVGTLFFRVGGNRPTDVETVKALHVFKNAGWIKDIHVEVVTARDLYDDTPPKERSLSDTETTRFWLEIERIVSEEGWEENGCVKIPWKDGIGLFEVFFCPDGWTIDHANDRAIYDWPEIQSWLTKNGWRSSSELSKEDQERIVRYLGDEET